MQTWILRHALVLVALSAVAAASAVGDAREGDRNAVVEMTADLAYEPSELRIAPGTTVRWTNASQLVHTVTADASLAEDPAHVRLPDGAQPFNSGTIAPGESYERRFDVPGRYRYFCIPHEDEGMIGEIVVEAGG